MSQSTISWWNNLHLMHLSSGCPWPPALPGSESALSSSWLDQVATPKLFGWPLTPPQTSGKKKGSWNIHSQLCFPFNPTLRFCCVPLQLPTMGLLYAPFCLLLQDG